jgi:DNA-binding MarR family transcriptional regulator
VDKRAELAKQAWSSATQLFFGDEMHDRFHEAAREAGMPHPGALKALMGLDSDTPRSMRAMAEDMGCDASYVTALVDALESRGYVERRVSPTDRRVKLVHVTKAGQSAQRRAEAVLHEPPKVLDRLTLAETKTLATLMAKLTDEPVP